MAPKKQPYRGQSVFKISSTRNDPLSEPIQYAHLTDDDLFELDYQVLQGGALLRLAKRYTARTIFDRVNAASPGSIGKVNDVSNHLTTALKAAARQAGCTEKQARARLAEERRKADVESAPRAKAAITQDSQNDLEPVGTAAPGIRFSKSLAPR